MPRLRRRQEHPLVFSLGRFRGSHCTQKDSLPPDYQPSEPFHYRTKVQVCNSSYLRTSVAQTAGTCLTTERAVRDVSKIQSAVDVGESKCLVSRITGHIPV